MMLDHGRQEIKDKCDSCGRDTYVIKVEDVFEDDDKAIRDEADKAPSDIPNSLDEEHDSTVNRESITQIEASRPTDIADVTSVIDDRDHDSEHFEEDQRDLEAENNAVDEIFKPVGTMLQSSCRNCGNSDHTFERKIRRRHCPAWNSYCETCSKRGHFSRVCKSSQSHSSSEDASLHLGQLAALR